MGISRGAGGGCGAGGGEAKGNGRGELWHEVSTRFRSSNRNPVIKVREWGDRCACVLVLTALLGTPAPKLCVLEGCWSAPYAQSLQVTV